MAVKGTFKDISFTELLQLMHMTQKTGRMEITIERRWAMVIFREGTVWHVEPRGFRGASPEEVLFEIMAMVDGNFVFQRLQVLPSLERTVTMPTETLIMEGVKRMDDAAVAADKLGGDTKQLEQVPKFKPGAEAKVRYVPQKTKQVLQVIDGHRTLKQVMQYSQMDAEEVSVIIQELVSKDVLELIEVDAEMVAAAQADMPAAPPPPPLPAAPPPTPAAPPPAPVAPPPPTEAPVLTITPAAPTPPAPPPAAPVAPPPPPPAAATAPRGAVLRVKPGSESNLRFMPQKAKRLLQALDGVRGVDEAIEISGVDREEAMKIISDLTTQGILEQI